MSKTKTVVYQQEDLEEYTPVPYLNLPDIEAEKCFRPKDGSRHFFIHCKPAKKYDGPCPHCGCIGTNYHSKGYISKQVKCGDYQVITPTLLSVSINIKFSSKPHYMLDGRRQICEGGDGKRGIH